MPKLFGEFDRLKRKCKVKILLILLMLATPAAARDDWTEANTWRQLAITALLAADCGQTVNGTSPEFMATHKVREGNPILGQQPSRPLVISYFAGTALVAWAAAYVMPERWRGIYQWSFIDFEAVMVGGNLSVGAEIKF